MKLRFRMLVAALFATATFATAFAGAADAWGGCIKRVNPETLEIETICY